MLPASSAMLAAFYAPYNARLARLPALDHVMGRREEQQARPSGSALAPGQSHGRPPPAADTAAAGVGVGGVGSGVSGAGKPRPPPAWLAAYA